MEKTLLVAVSPYTQQYYFNEKFQELPDSIKEELRVRIAVIAEKVNAIISLYFDEKGEIVFEMRYEDPMLYDDIGAELELKQLQTKEYELFKALKLWYKVYQTEEGEEIRKELLK